MAKIQFDIKDCQDCPECKREKHYTEDSWEHAENFYCKKAKDRKIAGYVEWRREMPPVPEWCPVKVIE